MYNLHSIFYLNDMFAKSQLFSTDLSLVTVKMPTKKRKLKEDERDSMKIRKN